MRKVSGTTGEKAEAAIRNVFEAGCAAWNRGDLDGYLASYWDSDQTRWVSSGSLTRGKKAIAAAYKARFSGSQQMGKLTVTELEIDVLTDTEAIAFGRWTLVIDHKSSTGFFTVQLRNIDGTWLFVSDHASA
ncbi:MAG TPA: SgcJ/EcaC family oxidoreductase [Anaerolineales bacterium]|nr:SgcJ/EcaC family oxidoreductase [Anaerolineales bacterium]